jgi:hypothetical protein
VSHNAENLSNDIIRILDVYDCIAGVVTDNTSTNKKVWKILADRYPAKFFYGCNCHALHLLVRDLFVPCEAESSHPVNYPLSEYKILIQNSMEIAKFFKRERATDTSRSTFPKTLG